MGGGAPLKIRGAPAPHTPILCHCMFIEGGNYPYPVISRLCEKNGHNFSILPRAYRKRGHATPIVVV